MSETVSEPSAAEFRDRLRTLTPRLWVTPFIVLANVAVFIYISLHGVSVLGAGGEEYLRFGVNFAPLTTDGEWWRLLTAIFVHFGALHLAFNLWALWDSGVLAERLYGNAHFLAVYLFAGLCGSCASLYWNPDVACGGASGAVFGVFGALLAYTLVQRGAVPSAAFNRLRVSSSSFVAYALFMGFMHGGIDNAAHAGGLAGGFAMGCLLARPLAIDARARNASYRVVLACLFAALTLFPAAYYMPDGSRMFRQARDLQQAIDAFRADEKRLQDQFMQVAAGSKKRGVDAATAARELKRDVLPAWDAAVARLEHVELDAKAPARADYEILLRYARARRDGMHAVAAYLESDDPAREKEIAVQRDIAAAALREYQARQK